MFPELLSQSIIKKLVNDFDPEKKGAAIEIGVGTDNFYSLKYKEEGLNCIAVDPLPHPPFIEISKELNIHFEEACIYDEEGEITLFCSDHSDLSSINKDWWGVEVNHQKKVRAMLLTTLLGKHKVNQITFLKIDTEGSEFEIVKQLQNLNQVQLPAIVEFEYGGGAIRESGNGAWSKQFFDKVIGIIELLQNLGYQQGLILDSNDIEPIFFDLKMLSEPASLFKPNYEYGNMLVFKNTINGKIEYENILLKAQSAAMAGYLDVLKAENNFLRVRFAQKQYLKRALNKARRIFNRLAR